MVTNWVLHFKQAAARQYGEMDQLAFQLFDADISPSDLINPDIDAGRLAALCDKILNEREERLAAEMTAALIQKVK